MNLNCKNCREEEGGIPLCKLGYLTQKGRPQNKMNKTIELRGQTAGSMLRGERYTPPTQCSTMLIATAPDWEEDISGRPFSGQVGEKILDLVQKAGLQLDDLYCTYMTKCKPPKGRRPAAAEIKSCGVHLQRELDLVQPKTVILIGADTLKLFRMHSMGGINAIHGKLYDKPFTFGDPEKLYKVMSTFSPAAFIHNHNPNLERRMLDDFRGIGRGTHKLTGLKPKNDFILADTVEKVREVVDEIKKEDWFAFDTESCALGFRKNPMICLTLTWKRVRNGPAPKCMNAVIPLYRHDDQPHTVYHDGRVMTPFEKKRGPGFFLKPAWANSTLPRMINILKEVFENPLYAKAAHNIKYDINVIRYWLGIEIEGFLFDTMLMHHVLVEQPPHGLEPLADLEFGVGDYSEPLRAICGHGSNLLKTYDHIPDKTLYPYATMDAENVYRLCEVYYDKLVAKPNLWLLYRQETEPAIRALAVAEWHGSLIDTKVVKDLKEEYQDKQEDLLVKMRAEVPPKPDCPEFEFNPMSTLQVRDALISLGFSKEIEDKHSPSGYSTSKEVLAKMKEMKIDLADWILQYRTNKKILSTYLEPALNDLDDDGRARYAWMLHGTTSGRLSCRFLHQIPRANEARRKRGAHNLRDMFMVAPGYKYVYFDYSQIELRVMALLANDETMLGMMDNNEDIHAATAAGILGCKPEEVTKFNRNLGKMMNFGLAYGSEGHQLVKAGEWEDAQGVRHPVTWNMVKSGRAQFKKNFPALATYLEVTPDIARLNQGILKTPFGRERRLGAKLNDRNESVRSAAEREAVNFTIQSTANSINLRTISMVHEAIQLNIVNGTLKEDDIFLLNTVHDSGAWEVRDHLVDWFKDTIKTIAEREIPELLNYNFGVDLGVGATWTEAEA